MRVGFKDRESFEMARELRIFCCKLVKRVSSVPKIVCKRCRRFSARPSGRREAVHCCMSAWAVITHRFGEFQGLSLALNCFSRASQRTRRCEAISSLASQKKKICIKLTFHHSPDPHLSVSSPTDFQFGVPCSAYAMEVWFRYRFLKKWIRLKKSFFPPLLFSPQTFSNPGNSEFFWISQKWLLWCVLANPSYQHFLTVTEPNRLHPEIIRKTLVSTLVMNFLRTRRRHISRNR